MLRRLRIENLVLIREAELVLAPGLNAVTGETGAGKTIFAQAIGLLLGARADASSVGSEGSEAFVEAELDVPDGFFDDEELTALADLRPEDESGLVIARRVFGDGRTRAYAWGRAVAREDVATAAERLIAMSGQFEQRRLARASFQLDVLDAFCGAEQLERRRDARTAWRELVVARRLLAELTQNADAVASRIAELQALVDATEGMEAGDEQELLHGESASGTWRSSPTRRASPQPRSRRTRATAPPPSRRAPSVPSHHSSASRPSLPPARRSFATSACDCARSAATSIASSRRSTPSRERSRASRSDCRRLRTSGGASPPRRTPSCSRGPPTPSESWAPSPTEGTRSRPLVAPSNGTKEQLAALTEALRAGRAANASRLGEAVADELASLGMGEGEFLVELREREVSSTGGDEATFLIRPNAGLPFAPIAATASGGELSRVALALAAVAGGETLVFDEIDAGIGGVTAHAVAATLQRLAERAQVLTITHLPQIASVADTHFRVAKIAGDPTHTRIEELDDLLRREEIERMAGGAEFIASLADS